MVLLLTIFLLFILVISLTGCLSSKNAKDELPSGSIIDKPNYNSYNPDDYYNGKRIDTMTKEETEKALIEIIHEAHPDIWDKNGNPVK